ncbi:MAG: immunoglobulin domain-containing protein [Ignavibacteria bacterium]|nr:immunoglobulin domain-containing protein [Ignavibacteria bacterium]
MRHYTIRAVFLLLFFSVLSSTMAFAQGQLSILSPSQGAMIESGTDILVHWESSDLGDLQARRTLLVIEISPDDGQHWITLRTDITTDVQEFVLPIDLSSKPSEQYRLRLSEMDNGAGQIQSPALSGRFEVFEGCMKTTFISELTSQTMCIGQPLTLSVETTAKYVTYVWMVNNNVIAETDVPTLEIPELTRELFGDYVVVVRKKCGLESFSEQASIRRAREPQFVTEPTEELTICEMRSAVLEAQAEGDGLMYQWYFNDEPIVDATLPQLVLEPATLARAGRYHVSVTNMCGVVAVSRPSTVRVLPIARITQQPRDTVACEGESVELSINADYAPFRVQWYHNSVLMPGETAATLSIESLNTQTIGRYSAIVLTDDGRPEECVREQYSRDAVVSMYGAPLIIRDITGREICEGASVDLIVEATGAVNGYTWYKDGAVIARTASNALTVKNVSASDAGRYSVHVRGLCGLVAQGQEVTLSVVKKPVIIEQPRNVLRREGQPFTLNVVADGQASYQWHKNSQPINGATSAEYRVDNATIAHSGSYSVVVTNSCGSIVSRNVRVLVSSTAPMFGNLEFATPRIDLGTVYLGVGHEENLIGLLKNVGNAPLSITSVSATSDLRIQTPNSFPRVLQPQAEGDVVARLVPSELGAYHSVVSFVNTGITDTARISFVGTVASAIDHPETVDLGTVRVNEVRDSCLSITNTSPFPIAVQAVTGSRPSDISVSASMPITLEPGSSFDVCVRFQPTTATEQSIGVVVQSFEGVLGRFIVRGTGDNVSPVSENAGSTSILVYPNPTSGSVNIRAEQPVVRIVVRTMLGAVVQDLQGASLTQWNGTSSNGAPVATGTYIVTVTTLSGSFTLPVVVQ